MQTLDRNPTVRRYGNSTGRDLHIDGPLSRITTAYMNETYIADQIFPIVPVNKETDIYYRWSKEDFLRVPNAERARGAAANRVTMSVSSDGYVAKQFSLAADIPLEDLANADDALDYEQSQALFVKDQLMLAYEDRVARMLINTSNVGSSVTLSANWDDESTKPIDTITAGKESIRQNTGRNPNLMIISGQVLSRLSKHPDIIEFVRGRGDNRGGGPVDATDIARAFRIPKILVGDNIKNTAAENFTGTYTDIWSTACILLHVAPNPGRMVPTYGYTFQWTPAGFPGQWAVDKYDNRKEHTRSIEVMHYQDEKIVATDLGYLILNG